MEKTIKDLLIRSLDGPVTERERRKLDKALARSAPLRAELKQLMRLREGLSKSRYSFKPFFADRVMAHIQPGGQFAAPVHDFFDALFYSFRRVAFAGAVLLVLLVSYHVIENKSLSFEGLLGFQELTLEEVWLPVDNSLWENMK